MENVVNTTLAQDVDNTIEQSEVDTFEKDVETNNDSNIIENEPIVEKELNKRIKSIDRFRGFCVFSMLVFQFLKEIPSLGFFARLAQHSLDSGIVIMPGMTIADIIAPSFIFAIGLTYVLSFNKFKQLYGAKQAYVKYALRALSIIGVGGILATVNKVLDSFGDYVLQPVDIMFLVFFSIALASLVFKLVCLAKPIPKKIKTVSNLVLYGALSVIGVLVMGVAFADFIALNIDINSQTFGYWVTLQNIGMACLIALLFIERKNWQRFIGASVIFLLYSVYHQIGDNQALLDVIPHGGFLGGFGWGAMLIFDLMVVDFYHKNKWQYLASVAMFTLAGLWSTMLFGNITLGSCSPSFILVGTGLAGLIFYIFHLTDKLPHTRFDPFVWWGKNPLMMFLVEFFIIGSFTSFAPAIMLEEAPVWLGIIEGVIAVVLLTTIAWLLSKPKKSISL